MPLQGGYSWHPGIPQTFLKIIHRGTTKKKEKNNENYARSQTKEWHMSGLLAQCVVYLDRAPMYVEIYQVYNKTKTCVLWFTIPSNSIILVLTHISGVTGAVCVDQVYRNAKTCLVIYHSKQQHYIGVDPYFRCYWCSVCMYLVRTPK